MGPTGWVLGIDIVESDVSLPPQAEMRTLDAFGVDPATLGAPFDVVISDMAPATTGHKNVDAIRSAGLCEAALYLAGQRLKRMEEEGV